MSRQGEPRGDIDPEVEHAVRAAYAAFNRRDIEAAVALMTPDVAWANGWEGGHVHGREAVGAYWRRQWAQIDPHVDPEKLTIDGNERVRVEVHQQIRDLDGNLLDEGRVTHLYTLRAGLVLRFDIDNAD
jgi:ketosteroid isomerase-like protein